MSTGAKSPTANAEHADGSTSVWTHIKAACDHNRDLSERVLWCLDVDWYRASVKFSALSRVDMLIHAALCWEWWAVVQYRIAYWVHKRKLPEMGSHRLLLRLLFLQQAILLRTCYITGKIVEGLSGARLNPLAEIGPGLLLMHTGSCGIGEGATIGSNFSMHQDSNIMARPGRPGPVIGNNVTLYSGARIAGSVRIGDRARIGANAVVLHDVPPDCLALGVPARPVQAGEHPPAYPASAQLKDLLTTLVEAGHLQEVSPGCYVDKITGEKLNFNV